MRVPQAAQRAHHAVAVTDVRRVRITLDVGVRVVLAMVGDPVDDRPWTDSMPRYAKTYRVSLCVWKARWVSIRWKPTVTPNR